MAGVSTAVGSVTGTVSVVTLAASGGTVWQTRTRTALWGLDDAPSRREVAFQEQMQRSVALARDEEEWLELEMIA